MYDQVFRAALSVVVVIGLGCSIVWAAEVDPSRFEVTVVASDLKQPMELEIAPDGSIFLIEIAGKVKQIQPKTGQVRELGQLQVTTAQENGLIGLALDPNFVENGWIYLQYSPPDYSGQHISRFTYRDGKLDLDSERRLFRFEEQRRECCHHAGALEFGPDGCLYIGTGDNTNPFNDSAGYAPIDQRPGREPWDAQRTAGNTKSYNGKILRICPEPDGTYSIPKGNLFPPDGSVGHPEIYVMGCRNPWRFTVDPRTGFLHWGDVGPDAGADGPRGPRGYDEINQAKRAGNFGWPYFIADNFAYAMVDFESGQVGAKLDPQRPVNRSVNNTGAEVLPPAQPAMIYYPGSQSDRFPQLGAGGRTACAGPVYYHDPDSSSQTKFPAAFDSTLFIYEWSRHTIFAARLNDNGDLVNLEPFLPERTFKRPIDMQFDANGSLYVIEYGETWGVNPDAQLIRIDYVRGNRKPQAVVKAENTVGREPLTVQLSAADSTDPDGDPLSYRWSIIRTEQAAETPPELHAQTDQPAAPTEVRRKRLATTETATAVFQEPGVYTIELEVADPDGAIGMTSLAVIVGNARPEVEFLAPRPGDFYTPGQPLRYEVAVHDIEDGTSDFDLAEDDGWKPIEGTALSRLFVIAEPYLSDIQAADANQPAGLRLMRGSDCLNCHAPDRNLVGPSFQAIADKYRSQPHQLDLSVQRVREGSTGVWGKVGMLPHQQHTVGEITQMVEYIFSLTADDSRPSATGFNNVLAIAEDQGQLRLVANYTDLGRGDLPKLTGTAEVLVRSRKVQAEAANDYRGTRPLGSKNAEQGQFMGAIDHLGYLRFDDLHLAENQRISIRVASAGAGADVQFRSGSVDGTLLGTTTVKVNNSWEDFQEQEVQLTNPPGQVTLYVVFTNEKSRSGLMNIDSLYFHP